MRQYLFLYIAGPKSKSASQFAIQARFLGQAIRRFDERVHFAVRPSEVVIFEDGELVAKLNRGLERVDGSPVFAPCWDVVECRQDAELSFV